MRKWNAGNFVGRIYKLDATDMTRVGDCWMRGRLKVGDLALCIHQSGDCFFNYILLESTLNSIRGIPQSKFGSYCFGGEMMDWEPTEDEIKILHSGEYMHEFSCPEKAKLLLDPRSIEMTIPRGNKFVLTFGSTEPATI